MLASSTHANVSISELVKHESPSKSDGSNADAHSGLQARQEPANARDTEHGE